MNAIVQLRATDSATGEGLPCRFTIIDAENGALAFVGAESDDRLAIREGIVYSLDGKATLRLAGDADIRLLHQGRFGLEKESLRVAATGGIAMTPHPIALGSALVAGGLVGFLPVVGFWMLPVGMIVLAQDIPRVRRWRRKAILLWGSRKEKRRP